MHVFITLSELSYQGAGMVSSRPLKYIGHIILITLFNSGGYMMICIETVAFD